MLAKLRRIFEFLSTRGALSAWIKWPLFSLAAFSIISRMKKMGINPETLIDIGANIGQFSVAATHLFETATIYPVEPDPDVAKQLKNNLDEKTARNILVSAVGDVSGEAMLHVNLDSQVSSLLALGPDRIKSFPDARVVDKISVPVDTLDNMFDPETLKEPILLKIDVQGFEDKVIAGASKILERTKWVLIEVSFSELYLGERDFMVLVKMMEARNFRFVRPLDFHVSPRTDEIIEMDALFIRE